MDPTPRTPAAGLGGGRGLPPPRDAAAHARLYTRALGWPVAAGHRYRPRGGCTCLESTGQPCPAPGAHPREGWTASLAVDDTYDQPGVSVIAPCRHFDALVMPRSTGQIAMVHLERRHHHAPPCLMTGTHALLLVASGTGRDAAATSIGLRAGPSDWIALPPSHGTAWDTPPWTEPTGDPVPLPTGAQMRDAVLTALRFTKPNASRL